tara:strand:- start:1 stop:513 length:513 start_codon:yes stop_codon:yes gene_type:complete
MADKKHPNATHGKSKTKLYAVWRGMKKRCYCLSRKDYKDYGGRGILVQESWRNDFEAFEMYVTSLDSYESIESPENTLSLDRINNNGNYEVGNIRWTSKSFQVRNRRVLKNNSSGYSGVHFSYKQYRARIQVNGKRVGLGQRPTAKEAYQLIIDYVKENNLKGFNLKEIQ